MDTDHSLLFGALALQAGLIDAEQFDAACKSWAARPDESFAEVLIDGGGIAPADKPHLEYLLQRALHKHRGDAQATLNALPSVLRRSLAALEQLDTASTVPGSAAQLGAVPSRAIRDNPALETRYANLVLHGAGGIGRVWRARDRHLDREVAIKELLPNNAGDAKIEARFLREARLTGQLEHPGIVPVYELASRTDTSQPFYTMRFISGRTLTSAIEAYHARRVDGQAEPLDFVGLLSAFVTVCHTIAYAHSRGVLHRDLKGDNVILGDFGEVIVLDWGLAKLIGQPDLDGGGAFQAVSDEAQDAGLTVHGEVMGTPAYMAPEQAEGRLDQIDQRTDIYGLGAVFYEILAGRPPFVGVNTMEVLRQAVRGNPPPPRQIVADVPAALEQICLKALAKNPGQRYASATDLAQEVQRWQDVQRRQAEDALRRQTEILGSILNGMSEGVIVTDTDGKLILINPAAERMIGRPSEPTLAATRGNVAFYRTDAITPFDPQDLPAARAIRGEEVDEAEMFIRPAHTGKGIWVSANARPLREESGRIRGGVVVFRDITERKRAEHELLRSRERFELAVRGSQDGLWDWDLRTNEIYYSPRWKSILGYEDHEIGHRLEEWEQRLHPDERERVLAANFAHIEGATAHYEYEYRLRHKDGSYRWILARGVALRDSSGKAYRMAGSHVDITERKLAEEERDRSLVAERETREALRASEEEYRSLANLLPGVVWTARADGWIDYANQFWSSFTGMTMEQTQGSGWTAMVHPEDLPKVTQLWSKALQTGEPFEVDARLKRAADSAYRWFLAQGKPLRDREGRVVKWFGMLTEIEDQKQNEMALERQNALVRLLHRVTIAAYEAATVEEALQAGIDQVCAFTGWPVGHVYVRAGHGSRELVPTTIWHLAHTEEFKSFVRVTEATPLAAGVGLPGRVLASQEPHWIMDVTQDANFPRAKAAENIGGKGAFAFPVLSPAGIVAVLEFFTREPKEPDELLLQGMVQVGIQLGHVFERKRAEAELRAAKEAAEAFHQHA